MATVTNRGWTDTNRNYVVDCDLLNPARNGECAAAIGNSANFGQVGAATIVDPDVLSGWGKRTHDYQTEVTVQQELLPRVSAEVSYIHRTFHGFFVTNDQNVDPVGDWVPYTIDAPRDPRLPDGGGYPMLVYARRATRPARGAHLLLGGPLRPVLRGEEDAAVAADDLVLGEAEDALGPRIPARPPLRQHHRREHAERHPRVGGGEVGHVRERLRAVAEVRGDPGLHRVDSDCRPTTRQRSEMHKIEPRAVIEPA